MRERERERERERGERERERERERVRERVAYHFHYKVCPFPGELRMFFFVQDNDYISSFTTRFLERGIK